MVTINGKEYGLFYSVGARCKFDKWLINNQQAPYTEGIIEQAILMNEAYNKANGTKDALTKDIIYSLPARELDALSEAVDAQRTADSTVTVEVADKPSKKAGSGAR